MIKSVQPSLSNHDPQSKYCISVTSGIAIPIIYALTVNAPWISCSKAVHSIPQIELTSTKIMETMVVFVLHTPSSIFRPQPGAMALSPQASFSLSFYGKRSIHAGTSSAQSGLLKRCNNLCSPTGGITSTGTGA